MQKQYIYIRDKILSRIICLAKNQGHLLTNDQFLMKRTQQNIPGQTVDKTMAKPIGVVKNQEKPIICNKAMIDKWLTFLNMT